MTVRKRICVVGLGQFGRELAQQLAKDADVLALDVDQKVIDGIAEHVQRALCLDARDFTALSSVVNDEFDEAIVGLGNSFEASVLCVLHLKQIGVPRIYAKATNPDHAEVLRTVGATHVISPDADTAQRIATRIIHPNLLDFIPITDDYMVVEANPPEAFVGHTLGELEVRRRYNVAVVAVKEEEGKQPVFLPKADFEVKATDTLILIASEKDLEALKKAETPLPKSTRPKARGKEAG